MNFIHNDPNFILITHRQPASNVFCITDYTHKQKHKWYVISPLFATSSAFHATLIFQGTRIEFLTIGDLDHIGGSTWSIVEVFKIEEEDNFKRH